MGELRFAPAESQESDRIEDDRGIKNVNFQGMKRTSYIRKDPVRNHPPKRTGKRMKW